jgi:pimeloyl-ACP methyl ester carboxylesterase
MIELVIQPFTIDIAPRAVAELQRRLENSRWPEGVTDMGGVHKASISRIVAQWRQGFDWFAQQERLNRYEHLIVDIDEVSVHAVVMRGPRGRSNAAIVLLHGWPGSFVELLPLATLLRDEFDVIVPSIPGFGFSSVPTTPGMTNRRIGALMTAVATALGHDTFAVHGGDIGAGVATWMAVDSPGRLDFLHLNFIPGSYWPEPAEVLTRAENEFLERRTGWLERFGAYGHLQRTTPLTPAYALSDSPVGLAAWVLEKFILWTDPASSIDDDILLTNLSLYWFTNTIGSSLRYYLESSQTPLRLTEEQRVQVPTHIAHFPYEMPFPPRMWVERRYAVARWTTMSRGGHFAALEAPELLAADITACSQRREREQPGR